MGECPSCGRFVCECSYSITYGDSADETVLRTWGGSVVRASPSPTPSVGDMVLERGDVLIWDGTSWVSRPPTSEDVDDEVDDDALKIIERRRIVQIIEEAVGLRLKPGLISKIADKLQDEGFRQD